MLESPYGLHLRIFPCFYDKPSDTGWKLLFSRLMDRADSALLSGGATQAQYDARTNALNRWANSVEIARK